MTQNQISHPPRQGTSQDAIEPETHTLYRFFDKNGALLYVGVTMDLPTRWRAHNKLKPWFHESASATLQHFDTRAEVLAAEVEAIKTERPLVNVKHNNDLPVDPDRLARLGAPSRRSPQVPVAELERRARGGEWLLTGSVARLLDVNRFNVGKIIKAGQIRYRLGVGAAKKPQRHCCPEDVLRLLDERRQEHRGELEESQ